MSAKKRSRTVARTRPVATHPVAQHQLFDADLLHPHGAPRITFEKPLPPAPTPLPPTVSDHVKGFLLRPDPVKKTVERKSEPVERKNESQSLHERFLARKSKTTVPTPVTHLSTPNVQTAAPAVVTPKGPSLSDRMKGFFLRSNRVTPSTASVAQPAAHEASHAHATTHAVKEVHPATATPPLPPSSTATPAAKPVTTSFQPTRRKKEKVAHKRLQRKSLQEYLDKAGFNVQAAFVRKRTFQTLLVLFLLISTYVLFAAGRWGSGALDVLIFMAALWTAGFAGAFLAAQGIIYFFLDYRIYKRTREIEEVLPDFLQLASSNIAAGMPIDRALWLSIRPSFGVLAKEMEVVAKSTMAGESLEDSLLRFADAYESPILKRSVAILIEGLRAGGEMADLLNKIALNIEELKIMRQEMAANVTTYAIFISFASVMVAPFLFALATQLLEIIIGITGSLDLASSGSAFSINAADPHVVERFRMFSIVMLGVSTAFSAALVSVIKRGNVLEGIKSIPVYSLSAIAVYYLSLAMLHGMFGGILPGG